MAVDSSGAVAAAGAAAFRAADFLAAAFGLATFFVATFFTVVRLVGTALPPVLAAAAVASAFTRLPAGFAAFLATLPAFATLTAAFLAAGGAFAAGSEALMPLLSTRKASRFFAPAIQPGARPNPDQVLPVTGSAYFATDAVFAFPDFAAFVLLVAGLPTTGLSQVLNR